MATESVVDASKGSGPSGFLTVAQSMLVVDYGKIYVDGVSVGFLHEDGLLKGNSAPLGPWPGLKAIEELPGCTFTGIDSRGHQLELPGAQVGPTGALTYNAVPYNVINGRISTPDHRLVGRMEDDGTIHWRDSKDASQILKAKDDTRLNSTFQGITSAKQPLNSDFVRPLHRRDRTYSDNEVIRYFQDFDRVTSPQKKYILESMRLWSSCGILQVVRKSEGDCAFGAVRHGASGVTGVRTGMVTIDKDEFEKEISLYSQFGALAVLSSHIRPFHEVRINLVVSHEFGHQLEFVLSQAVQDRIQDLFHQHLKRCDRMHPLPDQYEGLSELVTIQQIEQRVFLSGYSRTSWHEYWAEAVAAFSVRHSREMLKEFDPGVYDILNGIVFNPEKSLSPRHQEMIRELQTSLRMGGELVDDILEQA